ncbi:MAG: hypothetical protein FWG64_09105 [Firmicutes bacterium]|nr:hypothetical protein [Bacillota bacterium]
MQWYTIVTLTILGVHLANAIVYTLVSVFKFDEGIAIMFSVFTVFVPIWGLAYLVREIRDYSSRKSYYKSEKINLLSYLLGKRPKPKPREVKKQCGICKFIRLETCTDGFQYACTKHKVHTVTDFHFTCEMFEQKPIKEVFGKKE